jgi:hypothetical protein
MSSLIDLFNGINKTAAEQQTNNRVPDEWDKLAAANGMTTDQLLEKVAEQTVQEEAALVKSAQVSYAMGDYMAAGYWDTMNKVANAHPVRDGVPEVYIKIARATKNRLSEELQKIAIRGFAPEAVVESGLPQMLGKQTTPILERIGQLLAGAKGTAAGLGEKAWQATGGKGIRSAEEAITGIGRGVGGEGMVITPEARRAAAVEAAARLGLPIAGLGAAGAGGAYALSD